jgi:hypothetical protein
MTTQRTALLEWWWINKERKRCACNTAPAIIKRREFRAELYHSFGCFASYFNAPVSGTRPEQRKHWILCRYVTWALRFMDAYQKGLNGKQATWAAKKYHGHHVIPETILQELEAAKIT